eukprot:UN2279
MPVARALACDVRMGGTSVPGICTNASGKSGGRTNAAAATHHSESLCGCLGVHPSRLEASAIFSESRGNFFQLAGVWPVSVKLMPQFFVCGPRGPATAPRISREV